MTFRSMRTLLQALPKISSKPSSGSLVKSMSTGTTRPLMMKALSTPKPSVFSTTGLQQIRQFHALTLTPAVSKGFPIIPISASEGGIITSTPCRTIIKFSMTKGRRKTDKNVVKRFYRLDWGIWIHPKSGRHRHVWKKGKLRKKRLRQHVFCNATQTMMLDRMTTKYWHKKKYWVDDPYETYHTRNNFSVTKGIKPIKHERLS